MTWSRTQLPSSCLPVLFIAATTLSSSGCLTALGLNRSSLSPRTAATSENDSTFRSQDEELSQRLSRPVSAPPTTAGSGAGYSQFGSADRFLRARLLTPDFSQADHSPAASSSPEPAMEAGNAGGAAVNPSVESRPPAQTAQGSLPFSASQLREFMNNQSRNAMSEGQVLPEQPPQWQVLSTTGPSGSAAPPADPNSPVGSDAVSAQQAQQTPGLSTERPAVPVSSSAADSTGGAETVQPPTGEPSMLDRLKGFYEPAADVTSRSMWRRQFQRLQSPFNVFRERPEAVTAEGQSSPIQPSVRATPDGPAPTTEPPVVSETNRTELLDQMIAGRIQELQDWPRQANGNPEDLPEFLRRQQDLRLLYLIARQPGSAIQAVEDLPPGEQDFWQELMLALAQYRADDADISDEQRLTNTSGQLRSAIRHLLPLSSLGLRRLEICSRIHSFGRIEAFPSNDFDPGQPILLYAEVENFATEVTSNGTWRTRFDAQLQILEEGNDKPKETIDLASITDEATSERFDYYQSFELNLPSHLKSGPYFVRIRLRDRISGKVCEGRVAFQVR